MYDANGVVFATEPPLPMEYVGWGVLLVSLLIAGVWLFYLYR